MSSDAEPHFCLCAVYQAFKYKLPLAPSLMTARKASRLLAHLCICSVLSWLGKSSLCILVCVSTHFPSSPHFIYLSPAPSAPPQEVECVSTSSTTIRVSWVPPPAQSRNGVITQYSIAYQAVEGDDNTKHVVDGIGREHSSWEIKDLEKWTEYKVWVRAHTDVGPGPESIPVHVRTDEDGRCYRTAPSAPPLG